MNGDDAEWEALLLVEEEVFTASFGFGREEVATADDDRLAPPPLMLPGAAAGGGFGLWTSSPPV